MSLWALLRAAERAIPVTSVDPGRCTRRHGTDCEVCVTACPVDAIAVTAGEPARVDPEACVGCGVCVARCPTGAVRGVGPDETAVVTEIARGTAAGVRCEVARLLGEPGAYLDVPCLAGLHAETVAAAAVRRAETAGQGAVIDLVSGPCRRCPLRAAAEVTELLDQLDRLLVDTLGAVHRRELDETGAERTPGPAPAANPPRQRLSRRGLFRLRAQDPGSPPAAGQRPVAVPAVSAARAVWLAAGENPRLPTLTADPGCTACGGCVSICPTTALTLPRQGEQRSLTVDPARCVGCGECVRICPEDVLRLEPPGSCAPAVIAAVADRRCPGCGAVLQADEDRRCHRCRVGDDLAADIWSQLDR